MLAMLLAAPGGVFAQESAAGDVHQHPGTAGKLGRRGRLARECCRESDCRARSAQQRAGIEKLMAAAAASQQPAGMSGGLRACGARSRVRQGTAGSALPRCRRRNRWPLRSACPRPPAPAHLRDVQAMANESPAVKTAVDALSRVSAAPDEHECAHGASQHARSSAVRDRVGSRETAIADAAEKKLQCSDGEGGCPNKAAEEADEPAVLREAWTQIVAEYDRGAAWISTSRSPRCARHVQPISPRANATWRPRSFGTAAQSADPSPTARAIITTRCWSRWSSCCSCRRTLPNGRRRATRTHAINFHPFKETIRRSRGWCSENCRRSAGCRAARRPCTRTSAPASRRTDRRTCSAAGGPGPPGRRSGSTHAARCRRSARRCTAPPITK